MKKWVVGCLMVSVLALGACQKSETKTTAESTEKSSSVVEKSNSSTMVSTSSTSTTIESTLSSSSTVESISSATIESTISSSSEIQESTEVNNEPDNIAIAQQQLVGKSFSLMPSLYDGQAVDQAMAEQKAPQSLVHDGGSIVSFTDDSTAHIELAGAYRPDFDDSYTLTNDTLTVNNQTIPYSINNGVITFDSWTTESNGHTITWTFE